ncbi:uncharacterized protein BO66DRAFT_474235 [Aspergillus aculeatinus CBS 121060]|uniref:Uncharacterized protein n=1 Tax=Aspergillus aculeatinus CBS 121060 TaxID=1448322 RepID=A0ACD1GYU7_9EURO|nr:hypothetical protein BO66DRAFT_474235 [Aspergillus aculeatinus CBS 121060]RAH66502.1 hypothetical protein BO66DRAFT_474235 [Aspergillus aculeatinus CBS 121060]
MPSTTNTTTTTTPGNPGPPPAPTTDPATAAATSATTTTPTTLLWAYELRRENIELAARLAAAEATIAALQYQLKDVREELQVQVQKVCALKEREWEEMERRVQGVEDSVRGEVAVLAGLVEGVQGRVAGLMARREGGLGGEVGREDDGYGEEEVLVPDSMSAGAAGAGGGGGLGYMDGVGVSGGLRLGMGRGGGLSSTVEGESESTSWESGSLDCGGAGDGAGGRGDGSVVMAAGMASRMRGEVCKVASAAAAALQNDADGAFGGGSGRKINSQSVRDWVEVLENRGIVRKRKRARRFIPIVPADEEDVLIARAMMVGH